MSVGCSRPMASIASAIVPASSSSDWVRVFSGDCPKPGNSNAVHLETRGQELERAGDVEAAAAVEVDDGCARAGLEVADVETVGLDLVLDEGAGGLGRWVLLDLGHVVLLVGGSSLIGAASRRPRSLG